MRRLVAIPERHGTPGARQHNFREGGGEGKPSPEGYWRVNRKSSLNHPCPEGWWDFRRAKSQSSEGMQQQAAGKNKKEAGKEKTEEAAQTQNAGNVKVKLEPEDRSMKEKKSNHTAQAVQPERRTPMAVAMEICVRRF